MTFSDLTDIIDAVQYWRITLSVAIGLALGVLLACSLEWFTAVHFGIVVVIGLLLGLYWDHRCGGQGD